MERDLDESIVLRLTCKKSIGTLDSFWFQTSLLVKPEREKMPRQRAPMSAPVGEVQPGSAMVYMPYQTRSDICERYKREQSIRLGATQIINGIICVICNSVCLGLSYNGLCFIGHGYWCGILFMVTGIFGVIAGRRKTRCLIITFMVLSIISAALTIALLFFGVIGALTSRMFGYNCPGDRYDYDSYYKKSCDTSRTIVAMGLLLAISGLIEAVVAIWGSVLCCASGVCCCSSPMMVLPSVGYFPNTGQIFIDQTHVGGPYIYSAQPTFPHDQGLAAPPAYVPPSWSMPTTNIGPMLGQPTFLYDQDTTPPPAYAQPSWPMPTANIDPTHGQALPTYMANQAQPEACFQKMGP